VWDDTYQECGISTDGNYDFGPRTRIRGFPYGNNDSTYGTVGFVTGNVTWANWPLGFRDISFSPAGSVPLLPNIPGGLFSSNAVTLDLDNAYIQSGKFTNIPSGTAYLIRIAMRRLARFDDTGGGIYNIDAPDCNVQLDLYDGAIAGDNLVRASLMNQYVYSPASSPGINQSGVTTNNVRGRCIFPYGIRSFGTTPPTLRNPQDIGAMWYLKPDDKPLFWNGARWKYADGTNY